MSNLDFPFAEFYKLIFERLLSSPYGNDFRNGLGATSDSVLAADELKSKQPRAPYAVFRAGVINEAQVVLNAVQVRWLIYDTSDQGYWRINKLLPLLGRAYTAEPRISRVESKVVGPPVFTDVSGELSDSALRGDLYKFVTLRFLVT